MVMFVRHQTPLDYIEANRGRLMVEVIYKFIEDTGETYCVSPDGTGVYWYDTLAEAVEQHGALSTYTVSLA